MEFKTTLDKSLFMYLFYKYLYIQWYRRVIE